MPQSSRRAGALGVHSLDHFCISMPDLAVAKAFYERFGLDVRDARDGIELYTHGNAHCWARIVGGPRKAVQYLCFSQLLSGPAPPEDFVINPELVTAAPR